MFFGRFAKKISLLLAIQYLALSIMPVSASAVENISEDDASFYVREDALTDSASEGSFDASTEISLDDLASSADSQEEGTLASSVASSVGSSEASSEGSSEASGESSSSDSSDAASSEESTEDITEDDDYTDEDYGFIKSLTLNTHDILITDKEKPLILRIDSYEPKKAVFDSRKIIIWCLDMSMVDIDDYPDGKRPPIEYIHNEEDGSIIGFDISGLKESTVFYMKYEYLNVEDVFSEENPSDICRVTYIAPETKEEELIHFPQKNITIDLYKKHNQIPIDISLDNDSEHLSKSTEYSSPKDSILDVSFSEKSLNDFFDIDLMDGNEIDIKLKDSVVKAHASIDEINALIGDKYTTVLDFTFSSSGTFKIVTSKENLTLNINKGFPVSAGQITVNPYFAGVSEDGFNEYVPEFTGCAVTGFRLNNKASDIPRGFEVIENRCIRVTAEVNDKVKNGKIPLLVTLDDSFNTPFGSEIPVDVSYTLVNSMPKIKAVSALKGSLNPLVKETAIFELAINGPAEPEELTRPNFEIYDFKNRNVTDLFMASIEHNGNYILSIRNPDETTYGKTYKVKIWPENTVNHKKGSAVVYSLSVLSVKAAKKVSISASVKGEINVFNTSSAVTVTLKGKNISRFNEISCKVLSAKGDDLTDLFVCETDIQKNKIVIRENADNGANPYTLIKNNLDGKKVKIVITCKYGEDNKSLSVSKTVSIKRKSVTVKPSAAKVSLNPLTDRGYTFNYRLNGCNTRVFADCTLSYKKKVLDTRTSLLTDNFGSYEFAFSEIEDVSRYYGKTLDLKITPHLDKDHTQRSFKELKSITCKITVLNPSKSKVSFTSSSKGSINNVNDNSFVTISFKGKNTKASPVVLIDDTEVYRVNGKKKKISYTACFICALEDGKVIIKRNPFYGNYLATGAYKVDLKLSYDTYDGLKYCKSTASIKVTKGSCSYSFDKKTPELINNNTKRDTFYISNKNEATNDIVYVKVAEKNSIFDLMYLGDGKCSIGFTGGKHLEKKKDKKSPITSAVTKSVKLYVYNDGSNKPTLVTLKVKIYP